MRRLLWTLILFGAYMWVMSSGHDRMIIEQGKSLFKKAIAWLDDADVDFQLKKEKKSRKRHRRWD